MSDHNAVPFDQAFVPVPVGRRKIQESEYDLTGSICVVDQGQKLVSGHTNREDLLIEDGPYIVFGDHTRVVKYVDFPFVAGADGVRLFKAAANFEPEYLFLFLRSAELPLDGYGRHSKHLKDLLVPNASWEEQRRIAARLKAQLAEVETARQAAHTQLEDVRSLKSKALEAAFDGVGEWQPIGSVAKLQSGYAFKSETFKPSGVRLLRNANILPGKVYWDDTVHLSEEDARRFPSYELAAGDVLISLDRPIISSGVKVARVSDADLPALLLQRVGRFLLDPNQLDADYLYAYLQTDRFIAEISGHEQSLGVPHISPAQIEGIKIPLPRVATQRELAKRLTQFTEAWSSVAGALQRQLDDLAVLPERLLAQAFEN